MWPECALGHCTMPTSGRAFGKKGSLALTMNLGSAHAELATSLMMQRQGTSFCVPVYSCVGHSEELPNKRKHVLMAHSPALSDPCSRVSGGLDSEMHTERVVWWARKQRERAGPISASVTSLRGMTVGEQAPSDLKVCHWTRFPGKPSLGPASALSPSAVHSIH